MAKVIPFRALRYQDLAELPLVTAPPYDIISPAEQDLLYQKSAHNVIRLEYGKTSEQDSETDNRYTRAQQVLHEWLESGVLTRDDANSFYVYEELFEHKGQMKSLKGLIGLVELCDFSEKVVLPHEETLSKAKTDRLSLMQATGCNFSQIYSLYLDPEKRIPGLIDRISSGVKDVSFTSFDGLQQNLWTVKDNALTGEITRCFADKQLFIADGHHRYETALNYRNLMREQGRTDSAHNYVMMFLVEMEDPGLVVFPTHRLVRDLPGFDAAALLETLQTDFTVTEIEAKSALETLEAHSDVPAFVLYASGRAHLLCDKHAAEQRTPLEALDVSVLHNIILEQRLGIDKQNMAQQKNLTYTRDADEAFALVDSGAFQCAFLLNGTKVSQIKEISLRNEKMPQKSTYFYPKLITGIIMNQLD